MRERFGDARVGPYRMAIAFARLGDPDAAFSNGAQARDLNIVCMGRPVVRCVARRRAMAPRVAHYGLPDVAMRGAFAR